MFSAAGDSPISLEFWSSFSVTLMSFCRSCFLVIFLLSMSFLSRASRTSTSLLCPWPCFRLRAPAELRSFRKESASARLLSRPR